MISAHPQQAIPYLRRPSNFANPIYVDTSCDLYGVHNKKGFYCNLKYIL